MDKKLQDDIKDYFSEKNGVVALLIFGSHARNRETPQSDLDIAVLFARDSLPDLNKQLTFKADLENMARKDVDVIILNNANPILKYQVFKYGKILELKNRNLYEQFLVRSLNEYDDLKMIRRVIEESLSQRKIYGE